MEQSPEHPGANPGRSDGSFIDPYPQGVQVNEWSELQYGQLYKLHYY